MNELATMTTGEAAEALSRAGLAILPTGSHEQHGPHLPLDTDSAVANLLARAVAEQLGSAAVLCPLIPFGLSEHHLRFAGTVTLRDETYLAVLSDVFESLAHHGIRRILVVNGHGGNISALRLAASRARRDHGLMVASAMWSITAADVASEVATSATYGHACEVETSVVLALSPERVRTDRLDAPAARHSHDPLTDPPSATIDEPVWLDEWSDDGALGQPANATVAAGERIVEAFVERVVDYARRMLDREPPEVAS